MQSGRASQPGCIKRETGLKPLNGFRLKAACPDEPWRGRGLRRDASPFVRGPDRAFCAAACGGFGSGRSRLRERKRAEPRALNMGCAVDPRWRQITGVDRRVNPFLSTPF